jgi:ABC-type cobalamin transport system permease subunit
MMAIGLGMLVFGCVMAGALDTSRYFWDWRDLFSTVPACVGFLLALAGVIKWLWLVAP